MERYQVKQDGKVLFTSSEQVNPAESSTLPYNQCWIWLLKHQSASVDWAMKYEGYTIEPLTEQETASEE